MTARTRFDLAALAAVKPGLDGSLATVATGVERFLDAPGTNGAALEGALEELHRLQGVLKVAHLEGVGVFCAELETVLRELFANPILVSPLHRDTLHQALFGITHYLDALAAGASNAVLRLFPQYQALQQLRGIEMAFELDLFYPELEVDLPATVTEPPSLSGGAAAVKAARGLYQQSLLRWLRRDDPQAAIQTMQKAVRIALRAMPQDGRRAFWWVADGLLDCLRLDGLPPEMDARKLLGRIDQQMRAVAEGSAVEPQAVMNEMLFLIGHSHTVSDMVERIKQVYDVDQYLPEVAPLPPGEVAQVLATMRETLRAAEEEWEKLIQGNAAAGHGFAEHIAELAAQSDRLDRNTLQYLARQIHTIAQYPADPDSARPLAMDMAMALLLLGSGIEHYSHLGSAFQEQARILAERLQAVLKREPEDDAGMAQLIDLHCNMEQDEVVAPLVKEMLANLQQVEQGLNAFFEDADKRAELARLQQLLLQMLGGVRILALEQADRLLLSLRDGVSRFAQGDAVPKPLEARALAAAVSALEDYLQHLMHGQRADTAALEQATAGMAALGQTPAVPEPGEQPVAAPVAVRQSAEDQELLEVFLEEAQEVLSIMRENLEILHLHPDSREPLVTIRRGFHTLKGSGRMVGLTELGEVAWRVERAMNRWLQDERPATPGLLQFITEAARKFGLWVDALSRHGAAEVEASQLVALAERIADGGEPEEAVEPTVEAVPEPVPEPPAPAVEAEPVAEVPAAPVSAAPAAVPETVVQIGELSLSPTLFRIASEEARQHVETLQRLFAAFMAEQPHRVEYDFMRAAHTLGGVNRTLGFTAIAALAYALEGWLQARIDKPFRMDAGREAMLREAIEALTAMVQGVCERRAPEPQEALAARLLADKEALEAEMLVEETGAATPAVPAPAEPAPEPTAAPVAVALPATEKRRVRDEVDEQLLPVFLEEADDLYPKIGAELRAWRAAPEQAEHAELLKRLLHTLKGSARMAGAMRIGEIAHEMEDAVQAVHAKPELRDALDASSDEVGTLLEALRSGKPAEAPEAPHRRAGERGEERRTLEVGAERALLGNILRVRSDVVDRLVNEAGEISVARSRMETEMRAFKEGLLELTGSVARLRTQLREIEIQAESQMQARVAQTHEGAEQFDPLEFDRFTRLQELTRFMNESVHDVQTVQQTLLKNIDETAAAMSAQARLNRDLQQSLMSVRMVPFASISDRLYRIVRQTAKELNKRANLELSGVTVELDRSVLEKMTAPFEHLLRNAIVHGLEPETDRIRLGKPSLGEIRLNLRQESNEVVFEFGDDGAGLDFDALRANAEVRGLLQPGEAASEDQLAQLIFVSGLSTADEVTEVAGRGVGMDVVRSEIASLGGRIDVTSRRGEGTHFVIHLPLTLAVTQTLMVRAGDATYAIPSTMVEQVRQVKLTEMAALYRERKVEWQDRSYPLHYLPHLAGDTGRVAENLPRNPVLLLKSGEQRIALHVDELLGNQESVVKNIGPQLARLPGIAGATVLGNGKVVLILNPAQLAQRIGGAARKAAQAAPEVLHTQPLVMVVDDSLTVRKITTRLLQRSGYQVVTARDGVDALEQLGEILPAVMLLDVEMPRMDGFELTKQLRRDSRTQSLPIIMITSRTADKHRDHAMQLGVNAYLGKPYQEDELLRLIAGYVAVPEMG